MTTNKYIIKNCGNQDFCACKSVQPEDCLLKRIVELIRQAETKSEQLTFGEFKQYFDEDFVMKFWDMVEIEEVE